MKSLSILLTALFLVGNVSSVQAQCTYCQGASPCQLFVAAYCDNVHWPRYYVPPARNAVNSAYAVMINNGWRRQNLLGDYHFEEGTNELTHAGKLKANWVLTQAPQEQRTIYVQRANSQADTASRIAAVHSWAANQYSITEPIVVNDTHLVSEGHPAGAVDSVFVGFQTNQPAPVLPAASGAGNAVTAQ